ncbi:PAS domain-containing hybrid sensor histidine kinase/response regulator [Alkalicaulis satelles]|uniref:PAS domain-containing hybrid sensor histidine kinase/response regulator n=1 Tax=Alkalicaulis satelles TaxID=2609175 RepID=UPI0018ECE450|nr:PAS domain S-box protein [Alkalicaulis satelles]
MSDATLSGDILRRLSTLVQSASHMLVVMAPDRTITWVNRAWEERTGYTLDEVRGHNPGRFLRCPETGPEVGPTLRTAMEAGQRTQIDMLCAAKSGERYWLNIDVQPTYGPDGALDGFVAVHTDITGRKSQEQAALAARNRLQATLSALPDLVLEVDSKGHFTAAHASDPDLLTTAADALIGRTLEEVLPGDIAALGRQIMAEVDAQGLARGHRYRLDTKKGERWFEMSAAPRPPDTPDRETGYILVARDITGLHQAEDRLREANTRYDLAVSGSLMAIWDNDIVHRQLYFSPRFNEIIGGPEGDWYGPTDVFMDMLHPEDRPRIEAATQHHLATDEPYNQDMRIRDMRGGYVHARVRGKAIRDATGKAVRMAGSLIDITAERQAEDQARRLGVRAQIALNAGKLGVWEQDGASGMVSMDATLGELMHRPEIADRLLSPEEAYAFTHPEDLDMVREHLIRLIRGDVDEMHSEHRIVRPDGEAVWILAHVGVAGRDASGKPLRLVGVTQDLTGRKAAELRLQEALEAAEAASAAKSQFLANMSHEIRTPLNGVLGMAQLLELTGLDERQRSYVETIRASGRALQSVIEDVLDISRIEAGKLTLSPGPAHLADVISQAIHAGASDAARKGLEVHTEIDPALDAPVMVDGARLAQVLTNLISNAVKFTHEGHVAIHARALSSGRIRLEVEDTGPGLDHDMQLRIFDRFSQADMSPSRTHGGAGLGLAIARELTELAGGRIGVSSEPGKGALFWVEQPAPAAKKDPASPEPEISGAAPAGPLRRVLVVEDNPVNRSVAAGLLTEAGFQVSEAGSAADALRFLREGGVDAALLDLHMPGMGGDEALRRIRSGEAGPADLPVFILTADVTREARERLKDAGADRFFAKPVDAHALIHALRARLSQDAA